VLEVILILSALAIVYTYVGYPLLLGVFARWRRAPAAYAPAKPFVSLVIAAYNEQETIGAKVENSLALDYPADRFEIVVASDGSTDATADIVRRYASRGVRLSESPVRAGKTAAINRAMALTKGEIVVFSDANNLYDEGTLRAVVAPFSDPTVGAACGNKHIAHGDGPLGESEGTYWKYEGWIKRQETRLGSTVAVLGEVLAIRRELFEPAPENVINDDHYIALRILKRGYRVVYAPDAISRERVSATAEDEIARRTRMVAGLYQTLVRPRQLFPWKRPVVCWQLVSHKFMRPLVPLWMIATLAANVALVLQTGSALWIALLIGQIAFYTVAVIGLSRKADDRLSRALYVPTFLVSSNLAALLGLYRYSTGQQSPLWTRIRRRTWADD
jgi:cellulose synthase/poly-beta-1,6-N-acetylglucosamine synthase-like glycosyltransferase